MTIPSSAMSGPPNTVIESLGVYLPEKAVSTEEVLRGCAHPIRFPLEQMTGIASRRVAGEKEFSLDLAKKAVAECLAHSRYGPEDVDLLICANVSRSEGVNRVSYEPSSSLRLKRHFGFDHALALDVTNACAGMFTAILIIDALLKAGAIRRGMVVSGEFITHLTRTAQQEIATYLDPRLACLTLGDAGAAVLLEASATEGVGFHALDLFTLGKYSSLCIARPTDREHGGATLLTDAVHGAAAALEPAALHAAQTVRQSGRALESFRHVIPHQTSRISIREGLSETARLFGKDLEPITINNLAERGNTASNTHFVAIKDSILNGTIRSGDSVIFCISGSGLTIGTALYTFDDLPERLVQTCATLPGVNVVGTLRVPTKEGYTEAAPRGTVPFSSDENRDSPQPPPSPPLALSSVQRSRNALTTADRFLAPPFGPLPVARLVALGSSAAGGQDTVVDTRDLVRAAAEDCLRQTSFDRRDIDVLINVGVYRSGFLAEPAVAAMAAGDLGINPDHNPQDARKTLAFDIFNGSAGFLNACYAAAGMIHAGRARRVMIVASEVENNLEAGVPERRGVRQVGSAAIVERSEGPAGFGRFLFKYATQYVDSFASCAAQDGGRTYLAVKKSANLENYYLQIIGQAVRELLDAEGLTLDQIKAIVPPQISAAFVARLATLLQVGKERMACIADDGADWFTSSTVCALRFAHEHNMVAPGDVGLLINVGAGIQVGCALYYF